MNRDYFPPSFIFLLSTIIMFSVEEWWGTWIFLGFSILSLFWLLFEMIYSEEDSQTKSSTHKNSKVKKK